MNRQGLQKLQVLPVIEKAFVAALSLWAAAYAFLVNRNQGMGFAAANALLFFLVPCWLGFRYLNGRPFIRPERKKLLWGCFAVFTLAWVLLGLNSSSISLWREYLRGEYPNALWGHGRLIRSDEWAVWTPMLFSQAARGFPAVNTAINASSVDPAFIAIGGLPAWNLAAVYKPFYWGFLLFGLEAGYSIMTLLRFAGLFAVSCLCAQKYTKGSKPLSAAAAFLITLSPCVQWWFSQSICEVLLFAQLIVLCWIKALEEKNLLRQAALGAAAAWCFGCFVMVAYPAWLIPVAYLMIAVLVWLAVRSRKSLAFGAVLRMLASLLVSLGLLFFIFRESWDTLMSVRNSIYPGQRLYTGGSLPWNLFTGLFSLIFPATFNIEGTNACELSNFLSFAPAGLILALIRRIRTKQKDPFAAILVAFIAVFGVLSFLHLPAWLTQATLLSQCTRPAFIIGLCDLLLLLRSLSQWKKEWLGIRTGLALALACALLSVGLTYLVIRPSALLIAALLPVSFGIFWLLFSGTGRRMLPVALCLLSVVAGLFVNPVQQGFSEVEQLPTVSLARSSGLDPETDVLAVEADWPVPNSLLLAGYKVLNSSQPYADLERWAAVDPDRKWMNVYNRLCNYSLKVSSETEMLLPKKGEASIQTLMLTIGDLRTLGVTVLVTQNAYPELELIASADGWNLFRLEQ